MIILLLTIIAVMIYAAIRERKMANYSRSQLRLFRTNLCKGDLVRLNDGEIVVVTFVNSNIVQVMTDSGKIVIDKQNVLPLSLNLN